MIRILLLIEAIFGGYFFGRRFAAVIFLAAVLPPSFFDGRPPV